MRGDRRAPRPRRVFLEWGEVPRAAWGALRGEAVALRRILGARKAGRIGVGIALVALLLAAPLDAVVPLAAGHLLVALGVWGVLGRGPGLRPREVLRLSLWPVAPLLLAAAALRGFSDGSPVPAAAAIALASALLARGLSRGLARDAPPRSPSAGEPGAGPRRTGSDP